MPSALTKISVATLLAASLLLNGCSDPKTYDVAKLTDKQREELGKKLTAEEGGKLMGWTMRNALGGKEIPPGTTVRQALADQDEWLAKRKAQEAEAAALKAKVDAERKAKQDELAGIFSAALISKTNAEGEYGQRVVRLEMAFQNKSDKGIRGIKGSLIVNDIFGDRLQGVNLSYDTGIPAKGTAVYKGSVHMNQFMDNDKKFWNTDFDKLKSRFEVAMIIFDDGTEIKVPEVD